MIEEAPAPGLSQEFHDHIGQAAGESQEGEPALDPVGEQTGPPFPSPALGMRPCPPFPSPALMGGTCLSITVRAARAAGYVNAGTVEFIVDMGAGDPTQRPFFFMEMNTRLQVSTDDKEGSVPIWVPYFEDGLLLPVSETSTAQLREGRGGGGRGGEVLPLTHRPPLCLPPICLPLTLLRPPLRWSTPSLKR